MERTKMVGDVKANGIAVNCNTDQIAKKISV